MSLEPPHPCGLGLADQAPRCTRCRSPASIPQPTVCDFLPLRGAHSSRDKKLSPGRPALCCGPAAAGRPSWRCRPPSGRDGRGPEIAVKEITMAQIGTFTRGEDGTLSGTIRTLSLNVKARLIPTEPSQNGKAPDRACSPACRDRRCLHEGKRSHLCRCRLGHRLRQAARSLSSLGPPSCPRRPTCPHAALIRREQITKKACCRQLLH